MKVLITGESGYIAKNIQKHLAKKNPELNVKLCSVKKSIPNMQDISTLVHCAAIVHKKADKELYNKINYELTIKLAQAAKQSGVRHFIFLSTMAVYGDSVKKICKNTIPEPSSEYGRSKLKAEQRLAQLKANDFIISIIRPPMVYGENCPGNYAKLEKLSKITPVFPQVANNRSAVSVEVLCELIRLIILNRLGGLYFPQDKEYLSVSKTVKAIALKNGHTIILSKTLGNLMRFIKLPIIEKIFGSLVYTQELSTHFEDAYR